MRIKRQPRLAAILLPVLLAALPAAGMAASAPAVPGPSPVSAPLTAVPVNTAAAPAEREVFHLRELEVPFGYSQAVWVGDVIHVSGSVSMDAKGDVLGKGDMAVQLRNAFEDVRKSLAHFGADMGDVVRETIYTTDMDKLLANTAVRAEFYRGFDWPAATWLGTTRLVDPDFLVEVEVTAVLRPKQVAKP